MGNRKTKVTLTTQVQEYIEGMQQAARATREVGSETEKLQKQQEAFTRLGQASMVAGGAVVAGLTLATKAAIDWDSAWAGVTKTVDGSPEQLALVEQGLRRLTGVLPASHEEIAAVAEAAGQLGIKTPNVVAFTKTMIDLGETTNLSAEEAAMSLARFVNIMGTAQEDVGRLGSALVGLGNNYATTESEILAMSMRLAKSGVQIGLTEGEVLGLATSLSSVGIEAEAGGSAMSKVMIDIAAAVETGSDKLELFAKASGMTAEQFSQKWKTAPAEALAAFVKGLANAEQQGNSTLGVLAELGITEVRMRDALLGSAAAADDFAGAMAMGNREFQENNALTEEAEKRYETTAAKLSIMSNKVVDAAIGIGEQLLPFLEAGADAVGTFADTISGLEGPMQAVVAWGGLIVGTGLLGAGLWLAAIPKIAEYKAALVSLDLAGGRLARTMSMVGKVGGAVVAWGALISIARSAEIDVSKLSNAIERNADSVEMLDAAVDGYNNQGLMGLTGDLGAVSLEADKVSNYLARARGEFSDFWDYMDERTFGHAEQSGAIESLRVMGDELAKLGDTDLGGLQRNLRAVAEEFSLSREDMWTFIENSDALRETLEMQAGALGLTTDEADLLKIAYGEVGPAAEEAGDAASSAASDYVEQANAARAATDELYRLLDALMEQNSVAQTAEGANARYQQTLADVSDYIANAQAGLEGYSASMEANTVEGSKNREMFAGLAADSQAAAYALMEQETATLGAEAAAANYRARLEEGRQALIDQITALTGNHDAAVEFADAVYRIPDVHETQIIAETAQATDDIHAWLASIPSVVRVGLDTYRMSASEEARTLTRADGGIVQYANGGIASYAGDGVHPGIYSGGEPIIKFAEFETGWESFISGKRSERDRNRQVWVETGNRLGLGDLLQSLANGAQQRGGVNIGSVEFRSGSDRQQFRELEDTLDRLSRRVQ